jgi:beta-galactosidase
MDHNDFAMRPPRVSFTPRTYLVDGHPAYLCSGELHYFRVPRDDWRPRMRLLKEAGGNALATYVPWLLHEPSEGVFAWGAASPSLDLEAFLEAAAAEELFVIARPGPYQYSELVNDGLPEWLLRDYPDVLARTLQGRPFRRSSISYVHPVFMEKVRRWFAEVCPVLARFTASRGGPIAFVQVDNEMTGIHEWFGSLDYNPVSMGFGDPRGRYAAFLRERFGSVAELNTWYGTDYGAFEEARPAAAAMDPSTLRRTRDYFRFYLQTVAEYASFLTGLMRLHGIDAPIVHNSANPGMNANFLETAKALGRDFLLGSDHYYNLDQTWSQNHPTPQYAANVFVSLEQLRLMGYPPTVFELPGGSMSDWPPITPSDALACYMTNLAFGMRGHNYYIFTGGPNPPGAGTTTDVYDYNAAIGPRGEVRPLYEAQKAFAKAIRDRPWLVEAARLSDVRLALDNEQARAIPWPTGAVPARGARAVSPAEAWKTLRVGPLTTALCAGFSPAMVTLSREGLATVPEGCAPDSPLIVVSASSMAADGQRAIIEHLSGGGAVLILPVLPWLDEELAPCTLLADYLGAPVASPIPEGLPRPTIAGVAMVRGDVEALWERPPAGAEVLGKEERSGRVLAWRVRTAGGGTAVVCGMSWLHSMREHERMFTALAVALGARQVLHCSNPNVWAALWAKGNRAALFLLNLFSAPMEAAVRVNLPDGREMDLGTHALGPVTVKIVDIAL